MNNLDKRMLNFYLSAETKKYVKYSIHMHIMMACIIIVLMVFHFGNIYLKETIEFPEVPKPQIWQFIWLASLIPAVAGYMSLNKSRLALMKFYYMGTVACGLGPVLITMALNASDLWDYALTKETSNTFHDFPIIVLWYMFLFVVIQIHAFGIYFSSILIRIWSKDSAKKKH
jgi:hypothetical protein